MKALLSLVILISVNSAFAGDAFDTLTSVVALGDHLGSNQNGACVVSLKQVAFPKKEILVSVSDSISSNYKMIYEGSEFSYNARYKEFSQIDRQITGDLNGASYFEKEVRTLNISDSKLYVSVRFDDVTQGTIDPYLTECIIDL